MKTHATDLLERPARVPTSEKPLQLPAPEAFCPHIPSGSGECQWFYFEAVRFHTRVYTKRKMNRRELLAIAPACLVYGCSTAPAPKEEKKPAEPVTGLHALYQMYQRARTWSQDLKVLRLTSINLTQVTPQPGKAAAWQVIFASESLAQKRAYTFSVFDASVTLRQGIFPDSPSPWSNDNRAFLLAAAKIDTDQAWETALKHGEDYTARIPGCKSTTRWNWAETSTTPCGE